MLPIQQISHEEVLEGDPQETASKPVLTYRRSVRYDGVQLECGDVIFEGIGFAGKHYQCWSLFRI